jgi:hypothetical protein
MKRFTNIGLVLLVVFLLLQFIPTHRNENTQITSNDFNLYFKAPSKVASKLKTSCYDCHSNNTKYPWYNKIQPVAWFLENHINEAKEELNFSEFGNYSKRKQKSKLKRIFKEIKEDKMPLLSYELMHNEAKFTQNEKENILNWITELRNNSNNK